MSKISLIIGALIILLLASAASAGAPIARGNYTFVSFNSPNMTVQFTDLSAYGSYSNLVSSNPDFEAGAPSGSFGNSVTATRVTTYAHSGNYSLEMKGTSAAGNCYYALHTDLPATSTTYYWQIWVYSPIEITIHPANTILQVYDGSTYKTVGSGMINGNGAAQTLHAGTWTRMYGSGTTTGSAASTSYLIVRPADDTGSYDTTNNLYYDDVSIVSQANNTSVVRNWEFGDGHYSTDTNPLHTYTAPGAYLVNYTIVNASGVGTYSTQVGYAPRAYNMWVNRIFTPHMSQFDFVAHTNDFYYSFFGSFWFMLILLIPYIGLYNLQKSVLVPSVLYLLTGGIIAGTGMMPAYFGTAALFMIGIGATGLIYKLFVPD